MNTHRQLADASELFTDVQHENAFDVPQDVPGMPKILLIGDSISIGYTLSVRREFEGRALVYRVPTNAQDTAFGLQNIEAWLTERHYDLIHFNWGLWDLCYRNPEAQTQGHRDKIHGSIAAVPKVYETNLRNLVQRLKDHGAKLIWCSTTPVPEGELGRIAGDELIYNALAQKVMDEFGIATNELHAFASQHLPHISAGKRDVHFNGEGSALLGKEVARVIAKHLFME